MTLSRFIEWFTAIQVIVIALSHILQPRVWTDLFKDLFSRPYAGLVIGMFTLPFGLLIVLGHNVWVMGVPVIVTIIGFGWTIKGSLYLLVPGLAQRAARRHLDHPERFAIAGAMLGIIGAIVIVHLIFGDMPIVQ